jgi:hypothetical protein
MGLDTTTDEHVGFVDAGDYIDLNFAVFKIDREKENQ